MKIVFQDPTFSFQLLRAISETYYKGADIGECLSTAYHIKEGDFALVLPSEPVYDGVGNQIGCIMLDKVTGLWNGEQGPVIF
jgi:hypothetical protein